MRYSTGQHSLEMVPLSYLVIQGDGLRSNLKTGNDWSFRNPFVNWIRGRRSPKLLRTAPDSRA
jgi:hypothetical protein